MISFNLQKMGNNVFVPTTNATTITVLDNKVIFTFQNDPDNPNNTDNMNAIFTKNSFRITSHFGFDSTDFHIKDASIEMIPDNFQIQMLTSNVIDNPSLDLSVKSGNTKMFLSTNKPFELTTPSTKYIVDDDMICMNGTCRYDDLRICNNLSIINGSVICNDKIIHQFHKRI